MRSAADRVVILLASLSVLTLVLGLLGMSEAFGVAAMAVLLTPVWFGWRAAGQARRARRLLAGCATLYAGLVLLVFVLDDPTAAEPVIWFGYPRATAVFVYAIWPLGVLPALIYALLFPKTVLSDTDLTEFMKRFSKHRGSDRHGG